MTSINWVIEGDTVFLQGELSRSTIDSAFEKKTTHLLKSHELVIDLVDVEKIDTAGLAWLLFLIESSKKTKSEISFHNIPQDLLKLAKLSGVDFN